MIGTVAVPPSTCTLTVSVASTIRVAFCTTGTLLVVDTPPGEVDTPPADRPDERSRRDSFAQRAAEDEIVNLASDPGATPASAPSRASPGLTGSSSA